MDDEILTGAEETAAAEELLGDTQTETYEIVAEEVDLRPFLTTPFEEYTVSEGLLLLILLFAVITFCIKILKGGFYWL